MTGAPEPLVDFAGWPTAEVRLDVAPPLRRLVECEPCPLVPAAPAQHFVAFASSFVKRPDMPSPERLWHGDPMQGRSAFAHDFAARFSDEAFTGNPASAPLTNTKHLNCLPCLSKYDDVIYHRGMTNVAAGSSTKLCQAICFACSTAGPVALRRAPTAGVKLREAGALKRHHYTHSRGKLVLRQLFQLHGKISFFLGSVAPNKACEGSRVIATWPPGRRNSKVLL